MGELLLTLDTATSAGSVAVSRGERLLGEVLLDSPLTHSDRLLLTLRQLLTDLGLALAEVDAFGVVRGPGAFTGLRVGLATAKGLALATGKPVVGVSALATLALAAPHAPWPVCALLDARKQEVYAGLFSTRGGEPQPLGEEAVVPPERLLERLDGPTLFVGSGVAPYRTLIVRRLGAQAHFLPWAAQTPRASQAAVLALAALRRGEGGDAASLLPRYLRLSEAELAEARRAAAGAIEG